MMKLYRSIQKRSAIYLTIFGYIAVSLFLYCTCLVSLAAEAGMTAEETGQTITDTVAEVKAVSEIVCVDYIQKNVVLSWKKVSGASKYEIFRASGKKGDFSKIGETDKLYYNDKSAKKRKTYYYKILVIQEVINDDGTVTVNKSDFSKVKKVYVHPKKPKMVICGECYVEGIQYYAAKYVPKNMSMVCKVGINTTNILKLPYFEGKTAIKEVCSKKPDRVYFLVGANEFMNNTPNLTVKNFNKMRKILNKNNPNIEIVLIKISPQGKTGKDKDKVAARKKYNSAYKKFADKYDNVYFCNVTDFMDDGLGTLSPNCDAGDGCHWTPYAAKETMIILKQWSEKVLGAW